MIAIIDYGAGNLCCFGFHDVKDYQRGIVEQESDEEQEYYLSVLHGAMLL